MASSGARRVAAIDCGTNSLRLLIADIDAGRHSLADVQRRMEIVRLGQGVDATGRLAHQALARTFAMLEQYADAIGQSGAGAVRLVATSATRDASNSDEFSAGVRRILGIDPEVISGADEAYLSFSGATAELGQAGQDGAGGKGDQPEPPFLVVDIGGGSTEFVFGAAGAGRDDLAAISVNIGCVRLTERHLHADPPTQRAGQRRDRGHRCRAGHRRRSRPRRPGSDTRRAGGIGHDRDRARARAGRLTIRRGSTTRGSAPPACTRSRPACSAWTTSSGPPWP